MARVAGLAAALALAATGSATATPAAAPPCDTPHLVVWLDTAGNGAAGSVYYHLELTNLSSRACSLRGFPGVSAVTLLGQQIGSAATRNPTRVTTVTLRHAQTAVAVLRIVVAENYPRARCRPALAAGLRVYPPGSRVSKVIPFPLRACARTGVPVLSVGPVASRGP